MVYPKKEKTSRTTGSSLSMEENLFNRREAGEYDRD